MGDLSPDLAARSLVASSLPGFVLASLEPLAIARSHRMYHATSTDGDRVRFAFPPSPAVRILRFERFLVRSEAAVLHFLSSGPRQRDDRHQSQSFDAPQQPALSSPEDPSNPLIKYLPRILEYGTVRQKSGGLLEYTLVRPSRGETVSALTRPLSRDETISVHYQAGRLLRHLASFTSPSGEFGGARDVLSLTGLPTCAEEASSEAEAGAPRTWGFSCWSDGFLSLMEAALRDLEDMKVHIGYDAIRHHCHRFKHLLNAVKRPSFVLLNIFDDYNLLVARREPPSRPAPCRDDSNPDGLSTMEGMMPTTAERDPSRPQDGSPAATAKEGAGSSEPSHGDDAKEELRSSTPISVTGVQDWSNCVFGDPLIAQAFSEHACEGFWRAFTDPPSNMGCGSTASGAVDANPIEDHGHAHVRIYLYECYHAVLDIAREYVRPKRNGHDRDLVARKLLVNAVRKLNDLDDAGHPRHDPPADEGSPAKKTKTADSRGSGAVGAPCEGGSRCVHGALAS